MFYKFVIDLFPMREILQIKEIHGEVHAMTWLQTEPYFYYSGSVSKITLENVLLMQRCPTLSSSLLTTGADCGASWPFQVFGVTDSPEPTLEGNIFPNPVDPKTYMVLLCYKNGSLTREDLRNRYAERSWDMFNRLLEETAPLNGGKLGFYYKEHEILPPLPVGFHRYVVKNLTSGSLDEMVEEVDEFDPPSEVRAIIEGQFLSMRGHAEQCGLPVPPKRIMATGGASSNPTILKIMASIFGCPVYTSQRSGMPAQDIY